MKQITINKHNLIDINCFSDDKAHREMNGKSIHVWLRLKTAKCVDLIRHKETLLLNKFCDINIIML